MAIFVLCPAGHVTGGPETMHQLVHKARSLGLDAYIHYYDYGTATINDSSLQIIPEAYRHYQVATAPVVLDSPESVVIVMEIAPFLLRELPTSRQVMWWLSVDNFLTASRAGQGLQALPTDRDAYEFVFDCHRGITHLTHSEYGRIYLASKGVRALALGDYISDKFTEVRTELMNMPKRDRVAYNPKKGREFTQALIAAAGDSVEWVAIQSMTADEVAQTLATSKLYIDFGEHPGQDHLPKEAALAGCCVLTGTRGGAANSRDIPIPQRFKINEAAPGATERVLEVIGSILSGYDNVVGQFEDYRSWILSHEQLFMAQILDIFAKDGVLAAAAAA